MKLEEILPYIRKGYEPTFDGKEFSSSIRDKPFLLSSGDEMLLSDKWGYLPKYVDYLEAIKALIHGYIIRGDHKTLGRAYYKLHSNKQSLMQKGYEQHAWTLYGADIPVEWITATNFEIVED